MRQFTTRTILATLLLADCVAAKPLPYQDVCAVGRVVSVRVAPGCGVIAFGTPVTYEIMSGPKGMVGKQETALVSCIEFELDKNPHKFDVGQVHRLSLTKRRIFKFEYPSSPPPDWYYLGSASEVR